MSDTSADTDVIDVRDLIEFVESYEADDEANDDDDDKLNTITELLDELAGSGGDEQWQGQWYPITLVRDSHFLEYAEQLAEDIGAINAEASWPNNCIDWDRAARELQMDYTSVEYDSVTYWYR